MAKNVFLILLFFFLLFSHRLSLVPVHLNQDELMFSLNAASIAERGADYYGNRLPFYFWHLDNFWATPVIVYFSSIFIKFLSFGEASIRIPGVLGAVISIGLMIYLASLIFKNKSLALAAGIVLGTTPAFFINSRLMLDNTYPIIFVIIWLALLISRRYFLMGLILGLGIHSYHASKIYFPLFLLLSLLYILLSQKNRLKKILFGLVGFLIPVVMFIPWLKVHPDTLINQVSYVSSVDPAFANRNLSARVFAFAKNYAGYFDPEILFIEGDRTLVHSTQKAGVFLFPLVFLILFGIVSATMRKDNFAKLVLFGFLLYPAAPSLIEDPGRISRALIVIPFGVLLSVYGLEFLLRQKDIVFRKSLYLIYVLYLFLFVFFIRDYFTDYPRRSYRVFNGDIGGVVESALRSTKIRKVDNIYLDIHIPYIRYYYQFFEKKLGITFESVKDYDFKEDVFSNLPPASLLVTGRKLEGKEPIETVREADGVESYFIYEKI